MSRSAKTRIAQSRLATTAHYNPDAVEALDELRAELRACGLEDRIREVVASAPPIPPERAIEIADLLIRGAAAAQRREPSAAAQLSQREAS